MIQLFYKSLKTIVASEAAVERSFQTQSLLMGVKRNLLREKIMNAQLFLNINASKLDEKTATRSEPLARARFMTHNEWKVLCCSLAEPTNEGIRTRMQSRIEEAKTICRGSRVVVTFIQQDESGAETLVPYTGTVIAPVDKKPGTFSIIYDSNTKKFDTFCPTSDDTDWRFLTNAELNDVQTNAEPNE
jgi:hypothetical protein